MAKYWLVLPLAAVMALGMVAMAQDQGGGQNGGRQRGNRNFDPEQFRQQREQRYKEMLGVTDEEWKALSPKLQKVRDAQRDAQGGMFGAFGGFGGRGGPGGRGGDQQPQSQIGKAMQDLRTTLDNKDASADEIAKKLAAVREAREEGRKKLQDAQKELKELLTARQEAVLVTMGTLE